MCCYWKSIDFKTVTSHPPHLYLSPCERFYTWKVKTIMQTDRYIFERWETLIHYHFSHFLWRRTSCTYDPHSHPCPVTRKSPSHACLLRLCSSDTTNSSLPAPRLIKPSLLWLRPPLRLFWLAINGKNRCVGNEDSGRHANCVSLHPNIAAVQLREPLLVIVTYMVSSDVI